MEPLHPKMIAALKQAHPQLTDAEIDRCEELLARRMECDPEKEAATIAALDRERSELVQRCMPRFREVAQKFAAQTQATQAARAKRRPAPKVKVKRKR